MPRTEIDSSRRSRKKQEENGRRNLAVDEIPPHDPNILAGYRRGIRLLKPVRLFRLDEAALRTTKIANPVLFQYLHRAKQHRTRSAHFARIRSSVRGWIGDGHNGIGSPLRFLISASSIMLTTLGISLLAFHPNLVAAFDGSTLLRRMSVGRIKRSSIET